MGVASLQRTIAHEIGHALADIPDLGTWQNIMNVRAVEDGIMRELKSPALRLMYEKPPFGSPVLRNPDGSMGMY